MIKRIKEWYPKELNFKKIVIIFFICCILGWIIEVSWAYIRFGMFQNRSSVIYGPFSMVYGICGVILSILLFNYQYKETWKVFLLTMLLGTVCEYFLSLSHELICGYSAWNYSGLPLNINGRVCLIYSVFWGIIGVFWIKFLFPLIIHITIKIPRTVQKVFAIAFLIFFSANQIISFGAMERRRERAENIPANNLVDSFLDKHYPDHYLERVFPNNVMIKKKG